MGNEITRQCGGRACDAEDELGAVELWLELGRISCAVYATDATEGTPAFCQAMPTQSNASK